MSTTSGDWTASANGEVCALRIGFETSSRLAIPRHKYAGKHDAETLFIADLIADLTTKIIGQLLCVGREDDVLVGVPAHVPCREHIGSEVGLAVPGREADRETLDLAVGKRFRPHMHDLLAREADQPQERLVDERGRLQDVPGPFAGHLPGGEPMQLVLDDRGELAERGGIAGAPGGQDGRGGRILLVWHE